MKLHEAVHFDAQQQLVVLRNQPRVRNIAARTQLSRPRSGKDQGQQISDTVSASPDAARSQQGDSGPLPIAFAG
jgi:hypothetical protein